MTTLEVELRLSLIQVELGKLAERLAPTEPRAARIVRYACGVLGVLTAVRAA